MRGLSLILKPLSWVYGLVLRIRHFLYDRGFFFSKEFNQPIIKIGNLSFGGTGKSPMAIYIAEKLRTKFSIYVLSRGYGRKSKGVIEVTDTSHVNEVGDEPLMIKKRLSKIRVFVSKNRPAGISYINSIDSGRKVIILDDSIQHRRLSGGFTILLSEYNQPFYNQSLFPSGKLRDLKSRAKTSDVVIITKSPQTIENEETMFSEIAKHSKAPVYFARINYWPFKDFFTSQEVILNKNIVAVSAIASPVYFYEEILKHSYIVKKFEYQDHYKFSILDFNQWMDFCVKNQIKQVVMTEKDAVKIQQFSDSLRKFDISIIVLPIKMSLEDKAESFFSLIEDYINQYY